MQRFLNAIGVLTPLTSIVSADDTDFVIGSPEIDKGLGNTAKITGGRGRGGGRPLTLGDDLLR